LIKTAKNRPVTGPGHRNPFLRVIGVLTELFRRPSPWVKHWARMSYRPSRWVGGCRAPQAWSGLVPKASPGMVLGVSELP